MFIVLGLILIFFATGLAAYHFGICYYKVSAGIFILTILVSGLILACAGLIAAQIDWFKQFIVILNAIVDNQVIGICIASFAVGIAYGIGSNGSFNNDADN